MDYKKAYEEAMERAKQGLPIDEVFPEMKENEDERVRKWLIEEIKATHDYDSPTSRKCVDDALAYLERQKEQKPLSTEENELNSLAFLEQIAQDYVKGVKECNPEPTWDLIQTAVCYGYHLAEQRSSEWSEEDIKKIRSEEYTKGFNDAAFGGKLKEWSEEDEIHKLHTIQLIEDVKEWSEKDGLHHFLVARSMESISWLKSLRPQPHWKPSEEQMKALNEVVNILAESKNPHESDYLFNVLNGLRNSLKKL